MNRRDFLRVSAADMAAIVAAPLVGPMFSVPAPKLKFEWRGRTVMVSEMATPETWHMSGDLDALGDLWDFQEQAKQEGWVEEAGDAPR